MMVMVMDHDGPIPITQKKTKHTTSMYSLNSFQGSLNRFDGNPQIPPY